MAALALLHTPRIEICKKLFELQDFDFITVRQDKKHLKQELALKILTDNVTNEFCYGGAAGGAKSWTGCSWLIMMAICYPETRWFIGREELKRLRESTLITFYKVAKSFGLRRNLGYKYHAQDHFIEFTNGSRIDLLDLKYLPSDPQFERYGSTEYTGGWIEEGGEVHEGAYDTLKTRIGRQLNDKYGIVRKLFITCNPKRNWIYNDFYIPNKKGKMPANKQFLQAFVQDNPFRESGYEDALKSIKDPVKRARLLSGDFEYDDDPATLCDYDAITDLFTNDHVKRNGKKYLSADLAMKGRDRFVVGSWDGMVCDIIVDKEYADGPMIEKDLRSAMDKYGVGRSNTVVDSDGMGAYLEGYLNGIKEFHGGASAFVGMDKNKVETDKAEYANLKAQCAYKLADLVNKREIKISCSEDAKQKIIDQLNALKADDIDADTSKKRIISKEKMKEQLGCSPDYMDMLIMRMYFEVAPKKSKVYVYR